MEFWNKLIFPENLYCICCEDSIPVSRAHGLCDRCTERIDWNTANPFRSIMDEYDFDDVWPCCVYGFWPRKAVCALKKDGNPYVARNLACFLAERTEKPGILVPVPLHKDKLALRGFNQSALLARFTAEKLKLPYKDLLVKHRETPEMKSKSGEERRQMLKNCFSVRPEYMDSLAGQDVILVDDVVTTGSTAGAIASVLKAAGAEHVYVLCFSSANNARLNKK